MLPSRNLVLSPAFALGLCLAGCGLGTSSAWQADEPVAPLYATPTQVRVQKGIISINSLSEPLAPTLELSPDPGMRFVTVGFPIGDERPLAVFDYYIMDGGPEGTFPVGAGSESAEPTALFYDPEEMGDPLTLRKGKEETNGLDDDKLLVTWQTPHTTLVLVFEVAANQKTLTLHHGNRVFKLEPDAGVIEVQKPGAK